MVSVRTRVRVFAATFVVSLLVVLGCPNGQYPTTAYRCQPSSSEPDSRCPGNVSTSYQCCSDDPATLDLDNLDGPGLPPYHTLGGSDSGSGTPLFSADRNDASFSGMCIKVGSVAPSFALPGGCPVPCNPSWDRSSIDIVCGLGTFCCQTVEIEASDCVLDSNLGDAGCWRPARGEDIVGLGGLDATSWSAAEHATQQDPGLPGCEEFVGDLTNDELDAAGVTVDEVRLACLRRLGVANQRGFCIGGPGVAGCPLVQPSYRDACEQRNDGDGRAGCG
jgi:hypothetical protein